jgi:hypothetical protein
MENDLETTKLINHLTSVLTSGVKRILCNYSKKQQNLERKQQIVTQTLIQLLKTIEEDDNYSAEQTSFEPELDFLSQHIIFLQPKPELEPEHELELEPEHELELELEPEKTENNLLEKEHEYDDDISTITSKQDTKFDEDFDEQTQLPFESEPSITTNISQEDIKPVILENEKVKRIEKEIKEKEIKEEAKLIATIYSQLPDEESDEDEDEEYLEIELNGETYVTNDECNGFIFNLDDNGDIGNKVGYLKNQVPTFYENV